jgi:hypothetical protein
MSGRTCGFVIAPTQTNDNTIRSSHSVKANNRRALFFHGDCLWGHADSPLTPRVHLATHGSVGPSPDEGAIVVVRGAPGELFGTRGERATALAIAIYFIVFIAYAIGAQRGLVADGANYVVNIAAKHNFTFEEPGRRAAELLYQWPVVLAVRLGAQDLVLLSRLYTAGCYYLVFSSLVGSWLLLPAAQKHLILFPILTILFGWMASCYDGMVEIHALVLWFWPALFALLCRPLRRLRDIALVFGLSIPMAALYPMVILLAPVMGGVALWRWRRSMGDRYRWPWLVLGVWFVFVTANGARWILAPRVVPNRDSFLRALETLSFLAVPGEGVNWPLAFGLLSVPLLLICAWRPQTLHRWLLFWLPPFLLFAVFTALAPVVSLSTFDPSLQVDARAWEGIAAALIVLVLFAHLGGWIRFRGPGRSLRWRSSPSSAWRRSHGISPQRLSGQAGCRCSERFWLVTRGLSRSKKHPLVCNGSAHRPSRRWTGRGRILFSASSSPPMAGLPPSSPRQRAIMDGNHSIRRNLMHCRKCPALNTAIISRH